MANTTAPTDNTATHTSTKNYIMANVHFVSQDDTDARVNVKHTDMPNANGSDITAGNSYHTTKRVTTNTNANTHTTTHNTNAACATYAIDDTASGTRHVHTARTTTANNVNAIVQNDSYTRMAAHITKNKSRTSTMQPIVIHGMQWLRTTVRVWARLCGIVRIVQ